MSTARVFLLKVSRTHSLVAVLQKDGSIEYGPPLLSDSARTLFNTMLSFCQTESVAA